MWAKETSSSNFRSLTHAQKIELFCSNNHCLNFLHPGHFAKKCKSLNHCKHCQRLHHTLLHRKGEDHMPIPSASNDTTMAHTHVNSNVLLMTCQVIIETQEDYKAHTLLDTGSSVSFITEHLAQTLKLNRSTQEARICGIAGITYSNGRQAVTQFFITAAHSPGTRYSVNAFIVPQITVDQLTSPISDGKHSQGIALADPKYGKPGKIDILLGVSVFVEVICHGWQIGP